MTDPAEIRNEALEEAAQRVLTIPSAETRAGFARAIRALKSLTPQPAPEPVGLTMVPMEDHQAVIRLAHSLAEQLEELRAKEPPSAVLGGDAWTAGAKVMREAAAAYANRLGASATASLIQKMPIPTIPGQ